MLSSCPTQGEGTRGTVGLRGDRGRRLSWTTLDGRGSFRLPIARKRDSCEDQEVVWVGGRRVCRSHLHYFILINEIKPCLLNKEQLVNVMF